MSDTGTGVEMKGGERTASAQNEARIPVVSLPGVGDILVQQQARILELLEQPKPEEKPKPKDWWDRAGILASFMSAMAALVVGLAGLHFANVYRESEAAARDAAQQHTARTQRMQVLAQFIPFLTSQNPNQQRLAIRAIYRMGDAELLRAALYGLETTPMAAVDELRELSESRDVPAADRRVLQSTFRNVLQLQAVTEEDLRAAVAAPPP